jgi:hypothetical protein
MQRNNLTALHYYSAQGSGKMPNDRLDTMQQREGAPILPAGGTTHIGRLDGKVVIELTNELTGQWQRVFYTAEEAQELAAQLLYHAKTLYIKRESWGEQIEFKFTPFAADLPPADAEYTVE